MCVLTSYRPPLSLFHPLPSPLPGTTCMYTPTAQPATSLALAAALRCSMCVRKAHRRSWGLSRRAPRVNMNSLCTPTCSAHTRTCWGVVRPGVLYDLGSWSSL
ncbi:unnamed protein product [Closterium sp. NIES-54]